MTSAFLGIDAGGTSTRAVLVRSDGTALAQSRQAGGNPTSRGVEAALNSIAAAAHQALAGQDVAVRQCLLAMAGERDKIVVPRLAALLGLPAEAVQVVGDVEAMYFSGAFEPEGTSVIAGTGSIAARIADGEMTEVSGGAGWLLGDGGSGFWIGQQVVQAVVGDLFGLMPATSMTPLVLARLGLSDQVPGPREQLEHLVRVTYAGPPVQLSQYAPIAFEQASTDPVALQILDQAGVHLAALITRFPATGPLVLGGSVFTQGFVPRPGLSPTLEAALHGRDVRIAADGGAGAAFLALQRSGLGSRAAHIRIRQSLNEGEPITVE